MLKGINPMLTPDLLKVLCEMGHGVPEILQAILEVFPLDQYIDKPVSLMERCEGDLADVSIWKKYDEIVASADERGTSVICKLERFAFYEEAKKAYCIIATSETSQYANVILQKGCVL